MRYAGRPPHPPRPLARHPAPLRPPRRDHARDGVRRPARGPARRAGAERGGPRPRHHPGQHQPPRARADDHRPALPREDQRQHRQLRGDVVDRGRSGEAPLGDALGRRHRHGPLHRPRHPRDPRVDPPQLARADRDGADLPGAGESRRSCGGPHLGDLPRHTDRAGGAGRGLLHRPRRRAAPLRAPDGEPGDRHRLPRRFHHGQVVPGPSPGELPLHPLPRDLRDHGRVRCLVLTGRRAPAREYRRRERRGAVRRAAHPGRAERDRLGARRAGDERGAGPHPDAPHPGEHGEAARVVPRGAVLHPRARSPPTSRRDTTTSPAPSARP